MNPRQKEIQANLKKGRLDEKTMQSYWAAYLNMARHNLFVTLDFITRAMGCLPKQDSKVANEENIAKLTILDRTVHRLSPEDEEKARSLLLRHFPFLKIPRRTIHKDGGDESLDPKESIRTLNDLRKDLQNIAYALNQYRNKYSHSRPIGLKENISEGDCGSFLFQVLIHSQRQIKERYRANKNTAQEGMIDEMSLKFITEGVVSKDRKAYADDYYLRTLSDKDNKSLTDFGKLLLVCILIDKKYAAELLSQCHFLNAFSDNAQPPKLSERRLMLEVMTAMRIRLPEKKLNMEKHGIQIALDILNELKKCPEELFDLLGDEDRSKFNIISDTGDTILLKRHSDRFAQLALSYLDSSKAFNSLRFQVNAGKFRYLFRNEKHCIDGQMRPRVLEEPLNGYRRLMEFEKDRSGKQTGATTGLWPQFRILTEEESPRNDAKILPYITDSGVRYLFDGDNIGISFGDFTPSISKTDNGRYKVVGKVADCTLSKYELPALLFYHLLPTKHKRDSPEKIINSVVYNYRNLFIDIKDGQLRHVQDESKETLDKRLKETYNISLTDIPDKLAGYLTGVQKDTGFSEWKKGQIADLKADTENRIKHIGETLRKASSKDNKMGKRGYVFLKPGSYAAFIASDIVFFQECTATEKMTGLNFKVLQSSLATFQERSSTTFESLAQMFRNAKLITRNSGKGNHPFLYKVIEKHPCDIIDFYKAYLSERKTYLEGNIQDNAEFLHKGRKRWEQRNEDYYRNLAERYLERPVQLPRQLFEQAIRNILLSDALGKKGDSLKSVIRKAYDDGRCNTAFMILMYFYEYLDDSPQFFYGLTEGDLIHNFNYRFFTLIRNYPNETEAILKNLRNSKKRVSSGYLSELNSGLEWASKNPKKKSPSSHSHSNGSLTVNDLADALKKAYKQMMENERLFRRYAVQDAVLFLAARRVISTVTKGDFKLFDIKPQGGSILEQPVTVKTAYKGVDLSQENVKIKDYGKIYRLLHDGRVDDLLVRHKRQVVKMADLTEEINRYDSHRVDVFGNILDYERKISVGKRDDELMGDNRIIDFKAILKHDNQNTEEDKNKLRLIRNAFSHNEYPKDGKDKDNKKPVYYGEEIPGAADEIAGIIKEIEEKTS